MSKTLICAVLVVLSCFACSNQGTFTAENPVASSQMQSTDVISGAGAPSGGVKVDSACGGSDSFAQVDKEDNTINPGSTAVIWMNAPKGPCGNYHYTIFQNGSQIVAQDVLSFSCQGNYCRAYFTAPSSPEGTLNLLVESDCDGTQGADSFRLVPNSSCVK